MILDDFFTAAAAFDEDALAAILHPEARISELPNAINKDGTERSLEEAQTAFRRGRALLSEQSYDVKKVVVSDQTIAARTLWHGTLAVDAGPLKAGQRLTAHIATFTELRDGRIHRHATYDCYEPLT
jgi:ketosteroid isomerase-like protein